MDEQIKMQLRQPEKDKYPSGWLELRKLCIKLHPECTKCGKVIDPAKGKFELHHPSVDMYNVNLGDIPANEFTVLCPECHAEITGRDQWKRFNECISQNKRVYLSQLPDGVYIIKQVKCTPIVKGDETMVFAEFRVSDGKTELKDISNCWKGERSHKYAYMYAVNMGADIPNGAKLNYGDLIKMCNGLRGGFQIQDGKQQWMTYQDAVERIKNGQTTD